MLYVIQIIDMIFGKLYNKCMNCCISNKYKCLLLGAKNRIYDARTVRYALLKEIENLVDLGVNEFYVGSSTGFDYLCHQVLNMLKVVYPTITIKSILKESKSTELIEGYKEASGMCNIIVCYADMFCTNNDENMIIQQAKQEGKFVLNIYDAVGG